MTFRSLSLGIVSDNIGHPHDFSNKLLIGKLRSPISGEQPSNQQIYLALVEILTTSDLRSLFILLLRCTFACFSA